MDRWRCQREIPAPVSRDVTNFDNVYYGLVLFVCQSRNITLRPKVRND